jgi:hypothetical protein
MPGDRERRGLRPPWALNPLRSESEAFAMLLYVLAAALVIAVLVTVVRAL